MLFNSCRRIYCLSLKSYLEKERL